MAYFVRTSGRFLVRLSVTFGLILCSSSAISQNKSDAVYIETGKKRHCIPTFIIREAYAHDEQTLVFRVSGREYYLNRLDQKCPDLRHDAFTYTLNGVDELCAVDYITVLETGEVCGLGEFIEVKKEVDPAAHQKKVKALERAKANAKTKEKRKEKG